MTLYDIIFLTVILVVALAGVGLGFHTAFRLFDRKQKKIQDSYLSMPEPPRSVKSKPGGAQTGSLRDKVKTGAAKRKPP